MFNFGSSVIGALILSVCIAWCGGRCCVLAGSSMDPQHLFHLAASNIICSLIYGERFEYDNPVFLALISRIQDLTKIAIGPWAMVQNTIITTTAATPLLLIEIMIIQ